MRAFFMPGLALAYFLLEAGTVPGNKTPLKSTTYLSKKPFKINDLAPRSVPAPYGSVKRIFPNLQNKTTA